MFSFFFFFFFFFLFFFIAYSRQPSALFARSKVKATVFLRKHISIILVLKRIIKIKLKNDFANQFELFI